MTIPFTPFYRVRYDHTDKGYLLTLQRKVWFWWLDLQAVDISLNSDMRFDSGGVEYWPCKEFDVRIRAGEMFIDYAEKYLTS